MKRRKKRTCPRKRSRLEKAAIFAGVVLAPGGLFVAGTFALFKHLATPR